MAKTQSTPSAPTTTPDLPGAAPSVAVAPPPRNEMLFFALSNPKLVIGLTIFLLLLAVAIFGPMVSTTDPMAFGAPPSMPPSGQYWLGTTLFGQDVFSQFVHGLRASFIVGALAGVIAAVVGMTIGFVAGYRGGLVDDALNMLTNVVLVIPTFAVLLVIAAYLSVRGIFVEALFIGFTSWPWVARAIRAQTFSLAGRDFVDMARLSGKGTFGIVFTEIAPNMSSYLFMTLILLFGGSILIAATLDFIGLGPTNTVSLGLMMNYSVMNAALQLGLWWWFVPPGLGIAALVGALYVMNVGLDEVFNPRLREL